MCLERQLDGTEDRALPGRRDLPPGCSGDNAVDDDIDGKTETLVAIATDHLRGVGRQSTVIRRSAPRV